MATTAHAFQQACRARCASAALKNGPFISHAVCQSPRRAYATQGSNSGAASTSSQSRRRAITVTTDDGRYSWSELSTGEKAARTTQQSFNFLFVAAGAVGTIAVSYLLYAELFAGDSKTRQFNAAVDRVKHDPRCRELLGPASKIKAYGEPTSNKWARARPLAHASDVDRYGTAHFRMHFNVEGPDGRGVVHVHMTKRSNEDELSYKLLSLTVPGHKTIYLENAAAQNPARSVGKMFGVSWR